MQFAEDTSFSFVTRSKDMRLWRLRTGEKRDENIEDAKGRDAIFPLAIRQLTALHIIYYPVRAHELVASRARFSHGMDGWNKPASSRA